MTVSLLCVLASLSLEAAPPRECAVLPTGAKSRALAFSPDGSRLVTLDAERVRVWEVNSGKELHSLRWSGFADITHLTSDNTSSSWIGADRAVYQWKHTELKANRLTQPRTFTTRFTSTVVSPDGKTLAAITSDDRQFQLIPLLVEGRGRVPLTLPSVHDNEILFSRDSRLVALVSASRATVNIIEVANGGLINTIAPQNRKPTVFPVIALAPDGRSLLRYEGRTQIVETATGGERLRLPDHQHASSSSILAWSPNGRFVACGHRTGQVTVFDCYTKSETWIRNTNQGAIRTLTFSRDGKKLATGGDRSVILWTLPLSESLTTDLTDKKAWTYLRSNDASIGFTAIRHFVSSPDSANKWFIENLRLRRELSAKDIAKLIGDLDSEDFDVREKASDELVEIGPLVRGALVEELRNPRSLEVKRRCESLLRRLQIGLVPAEQLRSDRAIESLERMDTPEARRVLKKLMGKK